MAYIGKSPTGTGVRQRYYFTATGGETSLSGTDDNGLTLSYSDGAYVDVLLNGIELVAGTDYNTSTANTIAGLAALAASDVVTVTVYDIFTVADTVSAKDGGTFSGNVVMNADLTVDTDTLYVDSTNDRVSIGTTSPSEKFEILHSSDAALKWSKSGSSYSGYLYQDANGSGIFNAAGVAGEGFYLDRSGQYMYMTTAGTEAMRIDSSGNVLVGTGTFGNVNSNSFGFSPSSKYAAFSHANGTGGGTGYISFGYNTGEIGSITQSGTTGVAYNTTSDYRLKENDVDMTGAIARVKQLQPKRFNFIADADTTVDGFMAHEVQTVVPEAITGTHNEVDDDGNPVYQGIDQSKLVPLLTGALQEAIAKIEALEARVEALEDA